MRKYLECEKCDKTFKSRRALAGHMRLAHNVLMGEKQEIKDQLTRLEELKAQDGEALEELVDFVKRVFDDVKKLTDLIRQEVEKTSGLAEKVKDIETTLGETKAGLVEEEKEPVTANPGGKKEPVTANPDGKEKLKEELRAEILKELDDKAKKKKPKTLHDWLFGVEEEKSKEEKEDDDSIFL